MINCISCSSVANELIQVQGERGFYYCDNCNLVFANSIFNDGEDFFEQEDKELVDTLTQDYSLTNRSFFLHIGSGSGQLLKLVKAKSIPCYGIEKDIELSGIANERNVSTLNGELNVEVAWDLLSQVNPYTQGRKADVIFVRSELETTDNLDDLLESIQVILKDDGVVVIEINWLCDVLKRGMDGFNSYPRRSIFSLSALRDVLNRHDLEAVDIHRIEKTTRLRLIVRHKNIYPVSPFVTSFYGVEIQANVLDRQEILNQL